MITLRPYQAEALQKVVEDLSHQPHVLLQASTGAGKTILFSALIKHYLEQYQGRVRILVLAHREELVRQAYDKLMQVWPEGLGKIGIACASVSTAIDYTKPVLIGSIQTIARRLGEMHAVHLVIVDEVHRLPPMIPKDAKDAKRTQYQKVIDALKQVYPPLRLFGVTATPYRTKYGYIYGTECINASHNWFPNLSYSIKIEDLQEQGFLCPLEYMVPDEYHLDLSGISLGNNGDFMENELGELMSSGVHLQSAVDAFQKYASDRRHVVIFGVTIEHAEELQKVFKASGYPDCGIVHSKMSRTERRKNLHDFQTGDLRFVVNVGVLTEGWDAPWTDCILLCRPTKSTALYVQMVGRGLRIAEGKENCIVLDLANCHKEHGDVQNPRIRIGKYLVEELIRCTNCYELNEPQRKTCKKCGQPLQDEEEQEEEQGEQSRCPFCEAPCGPRDIRCSVCGRYIVNVKTNAPNMHKVTPPPPVRGARARILSVHTPRFDYVSKKQNRMIKFLLTVELEDAPEDALPINVNVFWDFEGNASTYGKSKARSAWMSLTHSFNRPPETIAEAEERWNELQFPSVVTIGRKDGWWNIERWSA